MDLTAAEIEALLRAVDTQRERIDSDDSEQLESAAKKLLKQLRAK